jgi:N utilization substance protein B
VRAKVETRARARALQALYAWDMRPGQQLERVAAQIWDDLHVPPDERKRAAVLVRQVIDAGVEIDRALREVTVNWRLERIGAIERSVLRLSSAELGLDDTPPRVVIHEGVKLAERYGSPQSARFVNGVLDALARQMGKL